MPVATGISEDGARICLSERPRERVMRARPQEARAHRVFFSNLLVVAVTRVAFEIEFFDPPQQSAVADRQEGGGLFLFAARFA